MADWKDTLKARRNGEVDGFIGSDESYEAAERRHAGDVDDKATTVDPGDDTPEVPAEPTPASDPSTPQAPNPLQRLNPFA